MRKGVDYNYGQTLLRLDNVHLKLTDGTTGKSRLILRNLNAVVDDIIRTDGTIAGQVLAFAGPSGIGKTQLLEMIAGLKKPTIGQVLINAEGKEVQKGQVGVVAQNYPLFEFMTVLSNLMTAAKRHGYKGEDVKNISLDWLEKFNLTHKADSWPGQLSGGERQRVAIAQQMICSDHFIIMDEPFSGLDLNMVTKTINIINNLSTMDELNTVIVITHDISAAVKIADHIWLLGHERDEQNNLIEGATIVERYNLIERNLAWHPDVEFTPEYEQFMREIKQRFKLLDYSKK